MSERNEIERLIGTCNYHARKAANKHDFYVSHSTASYREQAAKNTLDWAQLYADISERLIRLLALEYPEQ